MDYGDTYLDLNDKEKSFVQKMVYSEYLETLQVIYYNDPDSTVTVTEMLAYDLKMAKEDEDYEKCQLYTDVLKNI